MRLSFQKNILSFYKISLTLAVLLFPLANSDLFYVFIRKLYPARALLVVVIFVSALALFRKVYRKRSIQFIIEEIKKDRMLFLLLLLFVVRSASIINTLNLTASLLLLAFFASMISLYVILKYIFNSEPRFFGRLYGIHLYVLSGIGLFGLLQALILPFVKLPGVLLGGTFLRVPATFYDANHLPAYLLTGLPAILIVGWNYRSLRRQNLLLILTGILCIVVFLSFSRSGIAGLALSMGLIFVYCLYKGYWKKVGQMFSVLLLISFLVLISSRTQYSFTRRIFSSFSASEKSTVAHVALMYGELRLFLERPILGVGYGSFSEHFRRSTVGEEHAIIDPATQVRIPPHSLWLEALSETGIIGFTLYLSIILLVAESLFSGLKISRPKNERLYLLALLSGFIAINFSSIFYSYNLEFFWFYLFYCYLFGKASQNKPSVNINVNEERESLPWDIIKSSLWVVLPILFLLFIGLGNGFLGNEVTGQIAYISKYMLRRFEVGWPLFYIPSINDDFWFYRTPLYFWLGSIYMYLYYVTTFTGKFLSSFFGAASCFVLFLSIFFLYGRKSAYFGVMVLLASPLFLQIARGGGFGPVNLFFLLILANLFVFHRKNKLFLLFLVTIQAIFFMIDLWLALFVFIIEIFYLWCSKNSYLGRDNPFHKRITYLLIFIAFSFTPLIGWISFINNEFGWVYSSQLTLIPATGHSLFFSSVFWRFLSEWNFSIFPTFILVLSSLFAILITYIINRYYPVLFSGKFYKPTLVLLFLLALGNLNFFNEPINERRENMVRLIGERYRDDGRGDIPIFVRETDFGNILLYYSDIQIKKYPNDAWIEEEILGKQGEFSVIIDGESYRKIKRRLSGRNVGAIVLASSENLVLIKKW